MTSYAGNEAASSQLNSQKQWTSIKSDAAEVCISAGVTLSDSPQAVHLAVQIAGNN